MSMVNEQFAFLKDVCKLVQWCAEQGYIVTAGEMWRPVEMQKIYVQTGRSKTMKSKHLNRLAVDLNFFIGERLLTSLDEIEPIGTYWESLDEKNRWGGNFSSFKDAPHFERNLPLA